MRKYRAIFRTALQNSVTWRGAFWFYIGLNFLPLIGYYFLWTSIFQNRSSAAGFSYDALLTYAVVAMIFSRITWVSPEYGVMQNIREGTLAKYLVQPMSYFGYFWVSRLAFRTFALAITLPFTGLVVYLLRDHLLLPSAGWQWWGIAAAIPIAFCLQFLFGMTLGLLSFWILEARYFQFFKETALAFLGGMVLPFSFFPDAAQRLFELLPFRFLASFPVEVYLGRIPVERVLPGLLIGLAWVAGLQIITSLMWRRGLRRFVAFGN
ncbi:MAG: ABC-2 family transporter protein [Candidatus Kerfeldbacteria bacterium]|nr:ABC-2 family transporter protein [Candidatus Kerfeldbacteria bacterium]